MDPSRSSPSLLSVPGMDSASHRWSRVPLRGIPVFLSSSTASKWQCSILDSGVGFSWSFEWPIGIHVDASTPA